MKPFLQHCIGISIVIIAAGFFIRSIQPAHAGGIDASKFVSEEKGAGANVLWVNIDSIDANYEAFADLSKDAGDDYNSMLAAYQEKAKKLQDRYDLLQQKAQMGTISASDAAAEEASINSGMEQLKDMETNLANLEKEAMEKNAVITKDVADFLDEYAAAKNADYVLGYDASSNVLYANKKLDVTDEVLNGLNANYRKKNKKK